MIGRNDKKRVLFKSIKIEHIEYFKNLMKKP